MEVSSWVSSPSSCSLSPFRTQRIGGLRIGVGFFHVPVKLRPFRRIRSVQRFKSFQSQEIVILQVKSSTRHDLQRYKSSLESSFCYDKPIPEEINEKPIGLFLNRREIGSSPPCSDCRAKGAILCGTCSGSGLYVDSILESQGIIVKVKCLGCGGSGNILCPTCGGRGNARPN